MYLTLNSKEMKGSYLAINKVAAIKAYRALTGCSLAAAKTDIETVMRGRTLPVPFDPNHFYRYGGSYNLDLGQLSKSLSESGFSLGTNSPVNDSPRSGAVKTALIKALETAIEYGDYELAESLIPLVRSRT